MQAGTQQSLYHRLIKATADYVRWSTVEGVPLTPFRWQLIQTEQQAESAHLPLEDIRLALQLGEYQGRFGT